LDKGEGIVVTIMKRYRLQGRIQSSLSRRVNPSFQHLLRENRGLQTLPHFSTTQFYLCTPSLANYTFLCLGQERSRWYGPTGFGPYSPWKVGPQYSEPSPLDRYVGLEVGFDRFF